MNFGSRPNICWMSNRLLLICEPPPQISILWVQKTHSTNPSHNMWWWCSRRNARGRYWLFKRESKAIWKISWFFGVRKCLAELGSFTFFVFFVFSCQLHAPKPMTRRQQQGNDISILSLETPFSSVIFRSPLLLQKGIMLLHNNRYSFIKVMNVQFPPTVQTNSQEPLIRISQCQHDGTTARWGEGEQAEPGKSDSLPIITFGRAINATLYFSSQIRHFNSSLKLRQEVLFPVKPRLWFYIFLVKSVKLSLIMDERWRKGFISRFLQKSDQSNRNMSSFKHYL